MIAGIRRMLVAAITPTTVNAQIAALNTVYGSAAPNIVAVVDGCVASPEHLTDLPAVLHYVGLDPETGETVRFGKRDAQIPIVLAYHDNGAELATVRDAIDVTLEALIPLVQGLQGTELGSTGRQVMQVEELRLAVGRYDRDAAAVRIGGTLSAVLTSRVQGA